MTGDTEYLAQILRLYRIDDGELHEPASSGIAGVQHTFEGLRSEMTYLQTLTEGTGLTLQHPVPNAEGQFVTAGSRPQSMTSAPGGRPPSR